MEPQISQRKVCFYFFFMLLLVITLRLLYTAYSPDIDEVLYITAAKNVLAGQYHALDVWHSSMLRYVFVGIVSVFVYLFGATHFGVLWFPLLSTIGTFFVIYFIGKRLFNQRTALIACFLFAIFPLNIKYATILEADVVISFLMGVCLLLYLYRKQTWSYLLIGLILGIGIFVKFFILLLLPVLCIDLLKQREIKAIVFVGLGLLVGSVPFLLYQYVETGAILYHISLDKELAVEYREVHFINATTGYSFTDYILNPFIKNPEPSLFNIYPYLLTIAFVYFLYKREWNHYMLWLWVIFGYVIIELHPLIPSFQRYLLIIEIPLILFVASFITKIKNKKALALLLALIFAFSLYQLGFQTFFNPPYVYYGLPYETEEGIIAFALQNLPEKNTYITHYEQVFYLLYFINFSKNYSGPNGYYGETNTSFLDIYFVKDEIELEDSYVVLDLRYISKETMYINRYYQSTQSFGLDYALKHYPEWIYIQGIKNDKEGMYLALFYVGNDSDTLNQIMQYRKRTKQKSMKQKTQQRI